MSEQPLDPKRQMLIAALYGELSEEKEQEFQELLARDAGLRADWDELRETRVLLAEWAPEETAPAFEITEQEAAFLGPSSRRRGASPGLWAGLRGWFRGSWTPPAWGFAGATAVLVILILTGFRVDWVENGLVFRFGPDSQIVSGSSPGAGSMTATAPGNVDPGRIGPPSDGVRATPVAARGDLVTRHEMDYYSAGIMRMMSDMLVDYRNERNGELAYILGSLYEQLRSEQSEQYDDLKARVEGVGLGLMVEQSRANARLEYLMSPTSERGEKP
jgi:hypothetical protein